MEAYSGYCKVARAFFFGLLIGCGAMYFGLTAQADVEVVRPNANGTTGGTAVTCTGNLHWECLNEVVTQPTAPTSTASDYIRLANAEEVFLQMGTFPDIDTATSVTIWIYHRDEASNAFVTIGLYAANETTVYGTPTSVGSQTSETWSPMTFNGLTLTQAQVDGMRVKLDCEKTGGGKSNDCLIYAMYAEVNYDPVIEITVGATSENQQDLVIGTTTAHVGGTFSITENDSSRDVTSVTITENGTVDAANGLENIRLFYEFDNTLPYNCESVSYDGTESQFGATDVNGFSAANGISTFSTTSSITVTTTSTLCLYPVLDVATTTSAGQTIELQIADPTSDVAVTGTNLDFSPESAVSLPGTTVILAQNRDQVHYHWRNDDGDETDTGSGATSATGDEDVTLDTLGKEQEIRLRIGVSNEGNLTSDPTQYRLEYGLKETECADISSWTDVGATADEWDMFNSGNLTNGNNTTNIATSSGGVTDENSSYLTTNGGVRDTSSQTGSITLTDTQYVDLEFSIISSSTVTEGEQYCFRLTDAGEELETYSVYPEATILADVNVSTLGSQTATVDIPTVDAEAGARFVLVDNISGNNTVQSITLTASGTVDLQNDIDDIELYYDLDTNSPYNCVGETFSGTSTELQYGTTDTDGFSVGGQSTFSDTVSIGTTSAMCVYVVYSVSSNVTDGEAIEFRITNPATDVVLDSGTVSPAALVDFTGSTLFITNILNQAHYHWRNDDGDETDVGTGASSATGGSEDTPLDNLRTGIPIRLRIGIANEGTAAAPSHQYRLEFAQKISTCSAATGWVDVDGTDDEFNMFNTTNLTDGNDTTNIALANGGVSNDTDTFLTNNNGVKDISSQVASFALAGKNYTDFEFAITASTTATEGNTYCFRLTDAGTPFQASFYDVYPEATIKPRTDFFIQRNFIDITGRTATITAGTNYLAPSASTTAFIRIVGTNNVAAGSSGNTGNAIDVTAYISNPFNITNNIVFERPSGAAGTTRVYWEIIEYIGAPGGDNEIIVRQQQTATYGTGNTTVSTPTVAGIVDDNDVVPFITGQLNPDVGTAYPLGLSTAAWNAGSDTATFTRGASGNASGLSYAIVEFVGDNWLIQRSENTYSAAGSPELQSITAVNSMSRAFLHTQKRIALGLNNHSDFGHQVFLSGVGQITYTLESSASTPSSHTSVAWVIENEQSIGDTMRVSRSNSSNSSAGSPKTIVVPIGVTVSATQDASIFVNNTGNEANGGGGANSFPEPILGAELVSETEYNLWVAQSGGDTVAWRTEVVEWPTAARDIEQNYFHFYVNNDTLDPTDSWPAGVDSAGENTAITVNDGPIANGSTTRLRMSLNITSASMDAGIDTFKLQYGEIDGTCTGVNEEDWFDVGEIGSTTALWRGFDNPSVADGTNLSTDPPNAADLNLSLSTVAGTYEEQNPSAFTPFDVEPGEDVEYDWVIQNNNANDKTTYCFRMVEADGTLFDNYNIYPSMRTAGYEPLLSNWRWYDDETSLTPTSPLANENVAPSDVVNDNIVKLRLTVNEASGAPGSNIKFALQYSEYADFSQAVQTLTSTTSCAGDSLWCYADGNGDDNAQIDATVISDADTCTGGSGAGCGTFNESVSTTTATYDQPAFSTAEYEFTLKHDGARANTVYYFRLFDIKNATSVPLDTGSSYPSLSTQGAQLVFTIDGVDAGVTIAGQATDATTTATTIGFGSLPIGETREAAQRLTVNTNATEGYQLLMYATQQLTNINGETLPAITSSNAVPAGWATACSTSASGCFGYHTTDATLTGASPGRFGPNDSYAAVSPTTEEIMYSSIPVVDVREVLYRISVTLTQDVGDYTTDIVYIVVPVF